MNGGCILFGHQFGEHDGVGDYAGRRYRVCSECGITEEIELGRSGTTARDSAPLSTPTMPGSASPQAINADGSVNRSDLESKSAEIVGTRVVDLSHLLSGDPWDRQRQSLRRETDRDD